MKREGAVSRVLSSEKLRIEHKTIIVDLKENDGGMFVQIAELSNDRRSTVVIPLSGVELFKVALERVVEGAP
ncbi:MAG TPA: DNA-binding protein [Deltaproteobacteria bacterium]|nr:DNA-binding protein [Deltaproteobacteria bacterium]